jgi:AraC-like DNA-binding protein
MQPRVLEPRPFFDAVSVGARLRLRHCVFSRLSRAFEMGPRRIADHIVWYVVEGEMRGEVEGAPVTLGPGMVRWQSPGARDVFAVTQEPVSVFSLRFLLGSPESPWRLAAPHALFPASEVLRQRFERLELTARGGSGAADPVLRAWLVLLLAEARDQHRAAQGGASAAFTAAEVSRLHRHFDERVGEGVTPPDLAATLRLSHDHFARKFRRHFGKSPRQWLNEQRLRKGQNLLLESNLSMKEIASELGYTDSRRFARQFKAFQGVSPTAYRAALGQGGA